MARHLAIEPRTATTGPVRSSVVVMLTASASIALASGRPTATTGSAGGQYAVSRASASVPFPPFLRNSFCRDRRIANDDIMISSEYENG